MLFEWQQHLDQQLKIQQDHALALSLSLPLGTLTLWLWLFSLMAWRAFTPDARRGLFRPMADVVKMAAKFFL